MAEHVADALVEVGVPATESSVIPNGVNVPAESGRGGTDDGPVRIGLLGRLDPQKGADVFVEAARKIGGDAELLLGLSMSRPVRAECSRLRGRRVSRS